MPLTNFLHFYHCYCIMIFQQDDDVKVIIHISNNFFFFVIFGRLFKTRLPLAHKCIGTFCLGRLAINSSLNLDLANSKLLGCE
jgi:hypothetical protein